jgi:hypothetical protein
MDALETPDDDNQDFDIAEIIKKSLKTAAMVSEFSKI